MTPGLLMALAGGSLVVSAIALIVNFSTIWKNPGKMLDGEGVGLHLLFGALTAASGATLAAGFIWFLVANYA